MPKHATRKPDILFRNAKPRDKTYELADGGGLSLRVQPNGSKLWMFRYCRPGLGTNNYMSLGPYADITPARARELASVVRTQVRDSIDPVAQRRETKAALKRAVQERFEIVANDWLATKRKGWSASRVRSAEQCFRTYLMPALKHKPVSTLSTTDVIPVIKKIAETAKATVPKARQFLNAVLAFAVQNGLR